MPQRWKLPSPTKLTRTSPFSISGTLSISTGTTTRSKRTIFSSPRTTLRIGSSPGKTKLVVVVCQNHWTTTRVWDVVVHHWSVSVTSAEFTSEKNVGGVRQRKVIVGQVFRGWSNLGPLAMLMTVSFGLKEKGIVVFRTFFSSSPRTPLRFFRFKTNLVEVVRTKIRAHYYFSLID